MCNCQKLKAPPYTGRVGYLSSSPDPSCPTCRVGAFAPGQPLPPSGTVMLSPAGQAMLAAQPRIPQGSATPTPPQAPAAPVRDPLTGSVQVAFAPDRRQIAYIGGPTPETLYVPNDVFWAVGPSPNNLRLGLGYPRKVR